MNVSRRWLEDFLRTPLEARDVARKLAMLGAPVDAIEPLYPHLAGIRVALVEAVTPHPNADRLRLCIVNDGSAERRHVVCGAPNVTAGTKYPFAPVGATLPGGITIEKRKIRGELSEGMLCSARELGLGDDQEGLLELDTAAAPGTPFLAAVGVGDDRIVVDVTPNRPDLLGHKGIARELAAAIGTPFRLPVIPGAGALDIPPPRRGGVQGVAGGIAVQLEDLRGCRRFNAARIRGVRVGPSPAWLRRRLEAVGIHPISNVVDATNYVMLELNQPMHAYDAARLRGATLVVREARAGDPPLVTLDGVSRQLPPGATVIADAEGPIGLAGIMGGDGSKVTEATTDVLLEAAYWTPGGIRQTRRTLGMSTDASYRFERGIDLWAQPDAMRRCIELVLATAGGEVVGEPADLWPEPSSPPRIFLRPARVAQVLGVDLSWGAIEQALVAIGATVLAKPDDARLAVEVPGWRPDLREEIDLIEEIARIHGYDNFPVELRRYRGGALADAPIEAVKAAVRRGLTAEGLYEVSTLPLSPVGGAESVRLVNPPAADQPFLRAELLSGLVRCVVADNWAHQVRDVRLFEIGTVFRAGPPGARPVESVRVAGVVTGRREPRHWTGTGTGDFDRWDLKGLLEVAVALANPGASLQVERDAWVAVGADGRPVGRASLLRADAPPWAAPLLGFEVELDATPRPPARYQPLPTTPSSDRDLALLLPDGVVADQVRALVVRSAGPLLERVDILDEYRGPGIDPGRRSVMVRLTFRAPDRTLRDSDVDAIERRVLAALDRELGVRRRDGGGTKGA